MKTKVNSTRRTWLRTSAAVVGLAKFGGLGVMLSGLTNANAQSQSGGNKGAVVLGALFPLSGTLAELGTASFRGVELAVDRRNKSGGIAGGKKIVLEIGDAVTSEAAQSEVNRLIMQKGVKAVVGTYASSRSIPASAVANRNGVLYAEFGAVANEISKRGFKRLLVLNPPASNFAKVGFDFINEVIAPRLNKPITEIKVVVAHENSGYGTSIAESLQELTKESGAKGFIYRPYDSTANDLSSLVLNLKKDDPDVVFGVSYQKDAVLLLQQANAVGFNPKIFVGGGGGYSLQSFIDATRSLGEGVFDIEFPGYNMNQEAAVGLDEFIDIYKKKYGEHPTSPLSLANFMEMNVILDLVDEVGEVDPDRMMAAAMKLDIPRWTTATGWGVKFNENGLNTRSTTYVNQWQDGKLNTVWPEKIALTKIRFK